MKIAAFNIEKLFNRPHEFNLPQKKRRNKVIEAAADLRHLFEKSVYDEADRK